MSILVNQCCHHHWTLIRVNKSIRWISCKCNEWAERRKKNYIDRGARERRRKRGRSEFHTFPLTEQKDTTFSSHNIYHAFNTNWNWSPIISYKSLASFVEGWHNILIHWGRLVCTFSLSLRASTHFTMVSSVIRIIIELRPLYYPSRSRRNYLVFLLVYFPFFFDF